MGNLRQNYTDEEWEALGKAPIKKKDYLIEWTYEASLDMDIIEGTHEYYLDRGYENPESLKEELIRLETPSMEYVLGYVEALKRLKQTKSVYYNEIR